MKHQQELDAETMRVARATLDAEHAVAAARELAIYMALAQWLEQANDRLAEIDGEGDQSLLRQMGHVQAHVDAFELRLHEVTKGPG